MTNTRAKQSETQIRTPTPLSMTSGLAVILTGTDPAQIKGGIGTAVAGYRHALIKQGLFGGLIPTFKAGSLSGKLLPWLRAIPLLCSTIRHLKREGRQVVVYGHAGPRFSMARESLILLWAKLCGARTMMQLHTPHIDRYLDKAYARFLMRICFIPVEKVTVLSPWWQQRMTVGGFSDTAVIPNPLSPELEVVAQRRLEQGTTEFDSYDSNRNLTVLAMARLTRGKGVHVAVEAMQYLPHHVILRIAGDGPELAPLKALANKLGVSDRVRFLGWVSGTEKERQHTEADVFCAPSNADAFSMSMIEALSHGLPVVSVKSRAIADLVKNGETGFVVEVNNARAVAAAIGKLNEPSVRARMGMAAAAWVQDVLSGVAVGKQIEQTARELMLRVG